jgi:hypothetical protein
MSLASSKQKQEHDRFKHLKNHVPWPASVAIGHKSTTTNSGALRIVILPSDLTNDSGYGTILENGFDEVAKPYFGEVNSPRGSETYLENSVIENLANKVEPVVKAGLSEESSQKEETRSQCEPVSPALEAEGTSTDSSSEYWGDENMLDDERWAYIESETGRSSQLVRDRTVDYLMLKAYELGPNISNKTNGPEDGVEAKCRGSKASPDSFPGTTSTQGHKRALRQDESNDFDNEGRRKRLKPEDSVDIRLSGKSDRLACPFFQRTPLRYQNEVCTGPGFNNIKQLK